MPPLALSVKLGSPDRMLGRTRAVAPLLSLAVASFVWVMPKLAPSRGGLALAPAALALLLAFATRRPTLSLLLGALLGAGIAASRGRGENFAETLARYVEHVFADRDHQYILAFTLCLGIVARGASLHLKVVLHRAFEKRAGGALGPVRAQLIVWVSGLVVFIDDYLNSMLVGAASRPLFDRAGLSRAKLAFLVDATAAPVSSLAPISTWIAVELGYIAEYSARARTHGALGVFIESIPHRFYPLLMLVFALTGILMQREFGPMRSARPPPSEMVERDFLEGASSSRHWISGIVPMAAVFAVVIAVIAHQAHLAVDAGAVDWGSALAATNSLEALLYGAAGGSLLALLLESRQAGAIPSMLGLAAGGIKGMLPPCGILIAAWMLSATLDDLDTARQLAGYLPAGGGAWLAGAVFMIAALTSFATGTSWGTMAILFPLALPLALAADSSQGLLEVSVVGAVLAGAVFGDHCSPVSDTTVISAAAAGCDIMQHVITQLPYALVVGAIALAAHLAAGYAELSPWLLLLLGSLCVMGVVRWLGKPIADRPSLQRPGREQPQQR